MRDVIIARALLV